MEVSSLSSNGSSGGPPKERAIFAGKRIPVKAWSCPTVVAYRAGIDEMQCSVLA